MRRRAALLAAPLVLVAVSALAQGGDTVDLTKAASLSAKDSVAQARDYLTKMNNTQKRVISLQDRARKQKDVIKLNCVNDKLIQVNGHLAVSNQSMTALDGAVARGDDGARQHEFIRMTILYQKVVVLGTEAENCIGEDVSYVGQTTVDVEIDPNIPSDDPTQPQLPLPDVTRPPEATPFV
jgi:hypothetical protein